MNNKIYSPGDIAQKLWDITQERKELALREAQLRQQLLVYARDETLIAGRFIFLKEMRKGSGVTAIWKLIKTS